MVTHHSIPVGYDAGRHELLVMNLEVGLTGIVLVLADDQEEAIRLFERDNHACVVVSALAPER